jgi:hypothetical protein
MPQGVKPGIFSGALAVDDAGRNLRRAQGVADDVDVCFEVAVLVRKYESEFSLRTGELPLLERVEHEWPERDRAVAGFGFGFTNLVELVRALADVEFTALQLMRSFSHGVRVIIATISAKTRPA